MRIISPTIHGCTNSKPVQQQWKDSTTIQGVLAKYGFNPNQNRQPPGITLDSSMSSNSYHEGLIMIQKAQETFMQFPVKIRERFNHNPVELLKFIEDPKNAQEAIKLGIAQKPDTNDLEERLVKTLENLEQKDPAKAPEGEGGPKNP